MSDNQENKGKSIKIIIEKLDGGYVSNATGKRSIYRDANDILDVVGFDNILNKIDNDEYHLNIDLIPKSEYQDYMDLIDLTKNNLTETLTLESAKESGLIEKEGFTPFKEVEEENPNEIKVDRTNAYGIARLKAIDWKSFDDQLPMSIPEKAEIMGVNKTTLYSMWNKAVNGTMQYQLIKTRIAMTILAKFYEKNLGLRTSTKEQAEMMKETMLNCIREIELMASKNKFLPAKDIMKKLHETRNSLLK